MNHSKLNIIALGVSLLMLSFPSFAEDVIFQCDLAKGKEVKIVLVNGAPQYQFGKKGKPDITLPAIPGDVSNIRYFSLGIVGGGAFSYRFINGEYSYVVSVIDGRNAQEEKLMVFKGDKKISTLKCVGYGTSTSIYDPSNLPEEDREMF